ncbi:MAG: hypothetical protein AB7O38_14315 [Pirellulaceae bacterium]
MQTQNTQYLVFKRGEPTTRTVTFKVLQDSTSEFDERFKVVLGTPRRYGTSSQYGIVTDGVAIATILNDDINPRAMRYNALVVKGYVDGGSVFFDANGNQSRDFWDVNDNGIQDADEPEEPTTTTVADGRFELLVPVEFDRNGDGDLSADEGTVIASGGIDTGTLLPLAVPLSAPGGSHTVTPLTTLAARMMHAFGQTAVDAAAAIRNHFGLSAEIDLFRFDAIDGTLAGDPHAPLWESVAIQVNDTVALAARLLKGSGAGSTEPAAAFAFDALAARILAPETALDLADSGSIAELIAAAADRAGTVIGEPERIAAATVIAETNQRIADVELTADLGFLQRIKSVAVVALGPMALDVEAVGAGALPADQLVQRHTGLPLDQQIESAVVGTIRVPYASITDAAPLPISQDGIAVQQFTVLLSHSTAQTVAVGYRVFPEDPSFRLSPSEGTLEFAPGQTERTISVPIDMSTVPGAGARYYVELTSSQSATLGATIAIGSFDGPALVESVELPPRVVPWQPVELFAVVTDLAGQSHTATIDWGDGGIQPAQVDVFDGGSAVRSTHVYVDPGVYPVHVTITDGFGNVSVIEADVSVETLVLSDDPHYPGRKILALGATSRNDRMDFKSKRGGEAIDVWLNDRRLGRFAQDELSGLVAYGGDGNDRIRVGNGSDTEGGGGDSDGVDLLIRTMIFGGEGNDQIWGGQGNDYIDGGEGNDHLHGRGGDDTVEDWFGNNDISTGAGNDLVMAGDGNDTIVADGGNDVIHAGRGNNKVWSGSGDDIVTTGDGNDAIYTDGGNDVIDAGHGHNEVWSGSGDDIVTTGNGNDTVVAGSGNDEIDAGGGDDILAAGTGHDVILAGGGDDIILGGDGNDTITAGGDNDVILGGDGSDHIESGEGRDLLIGVREEDDVKSGHGEDVLLADFASLYDHLKALLLWLGRL